MLIAMLLKIIPSETAPKEDRSLIGVYVPPIPGKDINTIEQYSPRKKNTKIIPLCSVKNPATQMYYQILFLSLIHINA